MPSTTAPSAIKEMEDYVDLAVRLADGLTMKERLTKAAHLLGLTVGRTESYRYNKVRRVDADEADFVRQRVQRLEHLNKLRREYEAARNALLNTAPASVARLAPPALSAGPDRGAGEGRDASQEIEPGAPERRRA